MLTELFCRGADGQERVFYLEMPAYLDAWPLRVRVHRSSPPTPEVDDWFSLTLDSFQGGLIVAEINHNQKEWYARKGIGGALLPEMARITGLRIYSSSNTIKKYPNEYRSIGAGTLWLRLLQEGIADYLPDEDRFFLPRHVSQPDLSSSELATLSLNTARPTKPLAVFPDIVPVTYKVSHFLPIQSDDIATNDDLRKLIELLYDDPGCAVYLYFEHGKSLTDVLQEARRDGHLDLSDMSFYYYKHPAAKSRRDYLQITPDQLDDSPVDRHDVEYLVWKKAIAAVGPMYCQITVKLTPRMQRYCEMRQAAEMQREVRDSAANPRLHIDEIDSFSSIRSVAPSAVSDLLKDGYLDVSEDTVQKALEEILNVPVHKKDWGGEINDLYTANVVVAGRRVETAFLLKGNGLRKNRMEISDCGTNGDQLVRLVDSPARLFVVQFVGNIAENLIRDIHGKVMRLRGSGVDAAYCVVDGQDTARLLRAYGKK